MISVSRYSSKSLFIRCVLMVAITLLWQFNLYSQETACTLDIGGKDSQLIVEIFQLNEQQQGQLEEWVSELQTQSENIEEKIQKLLDHHPQSTEADLLNLARKYAVLKDELVTLTLQYDQKLLGIFNEKQYAFYKELCTEAARRPLNPIYQQE